MNYRCPKCKEPLNKTNHMYRCMNQHSYDIAKQGYVHLLLGNKKMTGDNQDMVKARTQFLEHGYYEQLRQSICDRLKEIQPKVLLDAGCGQGYYTNACQRSLPDCAVYGFDLSKFALKEAAKGNKDVHYAIASVADLPVDDACADAVLSVFAPIYPKEISRICSSGGVLIKVGPGPKHLWGLKEILYDTVYENEMDGFTPFGFTLEQDALIEDQKTIVGQSDIDALFSMTPYAYRSPKAGREHLKQMQRMNTILQFHIEIWRKS